jgi:two-component system, response regulator, stage 0 sporulation protein F
VTHTILVVDDEPNIRLLYEKELRDEGYNVILAPDAREALKIIEQAVPSLVILDIKMPGMDGIEALGRILARDNSIPVVLNSAYSSYQESFLSWSADAYVIKSSDLTELKAKVRTILAVRGKR